MTTRSGCKIFLSILALFLSTVLGISLTVTYLDTRQVKFTAAQEKHFEEMKALAPKQWTSDEEDEEYDLSQLQEPCPRTNDWDNEWGDESTREWIEKLERHHEPMIEDGFNDAGIPGWKI